MNSNEELPPSSQGREPKALHVRCRNCLFFKKAAYFRAPCGSAEMGIKPYAKPCEHFTANHYSFDTVIDRPLTDFLESLSHDRLGDLTALLNQEIRTRRHGFTLGQLVYIRLFQDEYLSNYCRASVIMANKDYVYVQGLDAKKKFRGMFRHESILNVKTFTLKKKSLVRRRRLVDPRLKEYTTLKVDASKVKVEYEPPTIDQLMGTTPKRRGQRPKSETKVKANGGGMSMVSVRRGR